MGVAGAIGIFGPLAYEKKDLNFKEERDESKCRKTVGHALTRYSNDKNTELITVHMESVR